MATKNTTKNLTKNTLNTCNHKELEIFLKIATQKNIPVMIWGAPGIGKSDTVRKVARIRCEEINKHREIEGKKPLTYSENKAHINNPDYFCLIDIRLTLMDPSDLRGIPFPGGENNDTAVWLRPDWFPVAGNGIIFLDEINIAPPMVQNAAYQLILDRRLGLFELPPEYSLIAAGNQEEYSFVVQQMPPPLQNRFVHAVLDVPDVESWRIWANENSVDPRVVAFLSWKPSLLFKLDEESSDHAFPTPRSWHALSKLISDIDSKDLEYSSVFRSISDDKTGKIENKYGLIAMLAMGSVGQAAGFEFANFIRFADDIPTAQEILKNPTEIKIKSDDPGLMYSIVGNLSYYIRKTVEKMSREEPQKLGKEGVDMLVSMFKFLQRISPEYVHLCMISVIKTTSDVVIENNKSGKPITLFDAAFSKDPSWAINYAQYIIQ